MREGNGVFPGGRGAGAAGEGTGSPGRPVSDRQPEGQTVRTERQAVVCPDRQLDNKGSGKETSTQPATEVDISQLAVHSLRKPGSHTAICHTHSQTDVAKGCTVGEAGPARWNKGRARASRTPASPWHHEIQS